MHACNDRAMSRVQDLLPPFLANSTGYGRPPQSYGRASPSGPARVCFLVFGAARVYYGGIYLSGRGCLFGCALLCVELTSQAACRAAAMEECGAARPTGARNAGSDGLKRSVGAAVNADTRPGARPRMPLAAAMLIPSPWSRPPIQDIAQPWRARRRVGLPGQHRHRHHDGARPGKRWKRRGRRGR
jgi:hypothetical protein